MLIPTAQNLDIDSDSDLACEGHRVLDNEASALRRCSETLDRTRFATAVRLLGSARGRVVVTGMGKSGLIGRKFVGTLSSTGTPALFLHAGEALHGDIGMVAPGDVACAFSYSGETDELTSILPALTRLDVPIIAFTARETSTLGMAAQVVLCVDVDSEACPMNLAPTTSTTVMLALSDALALALMQAKRFTTGDYAKLHPAGTLGRRLLLRVADIMRRGGDVAIIDRSATLLDAVTAYSRAHAGAAIIVDGDDKLAGLLTDGDFRRRVLADRNSFDQPVELAMNPRPGTVSPNILASEGLHLLKTFHPIPGELVGEAPVVDEEGRPIGMLTLKDLDRAGIATRP